MISQTAEYALRAIVYLADQEAPRTTAQIAEITLIPSGYLAKIMQSLGRTKLVIAQRGLNGGFKLARQSSEMTVLDVISAIDPVRGCPSCPLGQQNVELCPLHRMLDDAAKATEVVFRGTTIAQLLSVPHQKETTCSFPALPDSDR